MAKGMYKEWLESDKLMLLHGWKIKGLTDEQIAANIGIAPRTLWRWKNEHSQISQALKRGKEEANYIVENALFNKAIKGNTTAMIFYLKNNYPEKYSDNVTDPELLRQRIRTATAEADIAEIQAKIAKKGNSLPKLTIVDSWKPDDGGGDDQ